MMADRNNANFLAKFIGKDCLDECSWSSKSKKKNRLMDFKIFNDLYPRKLQYFQFCRPFKPLNLVNFGF